MALVVKDRIKETTATTGTGTLTLAGAVTKFQSFSVVGDGNTTYYAIESGNGSDWEIGVGTYTASGTTLSRDTILESSNAGSAINLSGTSTVFCTYPAERSVNTEDIGTTIQAYDADTAKYDDTTANFTGTLQNGGSNVVVDTDIGSTVQAYDADTTKNDVANTFTANQTINGDLTVDTNTLYVDSTNNRVGIGNTSPSQALEVAGNILISDSQSGTNGRVNHIVTNTESGASLAISAHSTGHTDATWGGATTADGVVLRAGASTSGGLNLITAASGAPITLWTALSERMRIDSGGNVGIGTSSPSNFGGTNLQISSPSSTAFASTLWVSGSYTMEALVNQNSAIMKLGARSNHHLSLVTNDTERMRIDSSGNVGIGTSSPTQKLDVNGTVKATSFSGSASGLTGIPAPSALSTASGSAPSYSARAWVSFNGIGTVSVRAGGNVSSITDHGTGDYSVNFTTAMPDSSYCVAGTSSTQSGAASYIWLSSGAALYGTFSRTTTSCRVQGSYVTNGLADADHMNVVFFR